MAGGGTAVRYAERTDAGPVFPLTPRKKHVSACCKKDLSPCAFLRLRLWLSLTYRVLFVVLPVLPSANR